MNSTHDLIIVKQYIINKLKIGSFEQFAIRLEQIKHLFKNRLLHLLTTK